MIRIRFNPLVFTTRDAIDRQIELAVEAAKLQTIDANNRALDLAGRNLELAKVNLELTREIVRLSRRHVPAVEEGEIEDPPTTAEADRIAARRGEQSQTPAPGPKQ